MTAALNAVQQAACNHSALVKYGKGISQSSNERTAGGALSSVAPSRTGPNSALTRSYTAQVRHALLCIEAHICNMPLQVQSCIMPATGGSAGM